MTNFVLCFVFFWLCCVFSFYLQLHSCEDITRTSTDQKAEIWGRTVCWDDGLLNDKHTGVLLSLHSLWLAQLCCCRVKKTKHHWLPQRALLPSQASVGLTLVGSSSSWQQPDTVTWFMAAPESPEQMTTQIRPLAVLSATHQEGDNAQTHRPFTHSAPQPPSRCRVHPLCGWNLSQDNRAKRK